MAQSPSKRRVCVLGAGVIGTSTAVCLLENLSDVQVTLMSDQFTPHNTSDAAAGLVSPHELGNTPISRIMYVMFYSIAI